MYWPPPFHLSAPPPGRADSPVDQEHSQSHFDMAFPTSEDIPRPPTPYFGPFGVSGGGKPDHQDELLPYLDIPNTGHPLMVEQDPNEQMQQNPEMMRTPLPQEAPMLPSDNPALYQQHSHPGQGLIRTARGRPYRTASNEALAVARDRPCRVNKKLTQRKRISKAQTVSMPRDSSKEPIRFKKDISEEDRFLIERRVQHHDNKGKTMWNCIGADYDGKYGTKSTKAALQMKVTRSKHKIEWPQRDVSPTPI